MARLGRGNTVDEYVEDEVDTPDAEPETDTVTDESDSKPSQTESLDNFWSAVNAVSDGDFSAVEAEYNQLSRGGKLQAKNAIRNKALQLVSQDDFAGAKSLGGALSAINEITPSAASTADPTVELVNRIASYRLANTQLSEANTNLEERIAALVAEPNEVVNALVTKLVETKMGRKPRETSGKRHDVGRHIAQVFAELESGTFKSVKELTEASSDEYGEDSATTASISAHLKSGKFDQPGLSVVERDGKPGVLKD